MSSDVSSVFRQLQVFQLRPEATRADFEKLCREAVIKKIQGICVPGSRVLESIAQLEETDVKVATIVGFPFGAMDSDAKRYEAEVAIDNGAHEIELVINIGKLKDNDISPLVREVRDVIEIAEGRPVAVVLETSLLTAEEKIWGCKIAVEAEAKSLKTSVGFSVPTAEEIKLLRQNLGEKFAITVAGNIRDAQSAQMLIDAGAARIAVPASSPVFEEFAQTN